MVGNCVKSIDGLHVHNGLVELEFFVDEDLLAECVALAFNKKVPLPVFEPWSPLPHTSWPPFSYRQPSAPWPCS